MPTVEELQHLLESRATEDRIRAVKRASCLPEESRRSFMLRALKDKNAFVADMAAQALRDCADEDALDEMTARFFWLAESGVKRDSGCHIRADLAMAFGTKVFTPAVEALRLGIRTVQVQAVGGVPFDTGAHLRACCALALSEIRPRDAVRDIALLLFSQDAKAVEPRKAAAQALARLADPASIVPLAIRLTYPEHESPDVIQECMQAVADLEDERALELLEPYLAHADQGLAAYAALMLARLKVPGVEALIRDLLMRLYGGPMEAVVLAVSAIRTEASLQLLMDLAADARQPVREAAQRELDALSIPMPQ